MQAPSIVDLLEREIPPTRSWIEPRILPYGGIMVLAASPKVGKSFFAQEMSRAIATGRAPFDSPDFSVPMKGKVLLLDYEVTEAGLQERCEKMLDVVDKETLRENFRYVSKDTDGYNLPAMVFSDPAGRSALYRLVEETQPNVLIIDTLRRALGAFSESDGTNIGQVFQFLDQLTHDFKHNHMSVVVNHHFRKSPTGKFKDDWDPLDADNASGSGRIFGDPDCLVTLHRDMNEKEYNRAGHEMWKVKTRWRLRHGEDPKDTFFSVNREDDLRVRYEGKVSDGPPAKIKTSPAKLLVPLRGEQEKLTFSSLT